MASKYSIVRWQNNYSLYCNNEIDFEQKFVTRYQEGNEGDELMDRIKEANIEDRDFRARGASAWGSLYLDGHDGTDLSLKMGGYHMDLITQIKRNRLTELLSVHVDRDNKTFGKYYDYEKMEIGLITPEPFFEKAKDIGTIVEKGTWGQLIQSKVHGGFIKNWDLREEVRNDLFYSIYQLATDVRATNQIENMITSRDYGIDYPKEVIVRILEEVIKYKFRTNKRKIIV